MFIRPLHDWIGALIVSLIALLAFSLGSCQEAHAFTEDEAVRAIIGEDSSSYEGMYAVACAIRNRGHLKGVYGFRAVRWSNGVLKRYSGARVSEVIGPNTLHLAQKAWFESEDGYDVTGGAKHWEGTQFKTPSWASEDSTVIGGNRFYRGVR